MPSGDECGRIRATQIGDQVRCEATLADELNTHCTVSFIFISSTNGRMSVSDNPQQDPPLTVEAKNGTASQKKIKNLNDDGTSSAARPKEAADNLK